MGGGSQGGPGASTLPETIDESTPIDGLINLLIGGAKGAGEMVDFVSGPVLEQATKRFSPDGSSMRFRDMVNLDPDPNSPAQNVGKELEQLAEFFVPANPTKAALIKRLVQMIPNSASPGMMKKLNSLAAFLGRTGGEAASAGAVSAAHGAENPEDSAIAAGTFGALGHLGKPVAQFASGQVGQKLAPLLAANAVMKIVPKMSGVSGQMGMFNLAKNTAAKVMGNPQALSRRTLNWVDRLSRATANTAGRGAAYSLEQQPRRKRLEGSRSR